MARIDKTYLLCFLGFQMHRSFVHPRTIEELVDYLKRALTGLRIEIASRGHVAVTLLPYNEAQLRFGLG